MSWKERLRMLFAKEAIVFKKKDTPNILQDFIEALLKETEQRVLEEEREKFDKYDNQRILAWLEANRWKDEAKKLGWYEEMRAREKYIKGVE